MFHNIVELLELLLDKACSSSGGTSGRDFQDLSRCLSEADVGAMACNNYEFLKVLIEEEINLDSVSSILQMLIRMNKSFENFVSLSRFSICFVDQQCCFKLNLVEFRFPSDSVS